MNSMINKELLFDHFSGRTTALQKRLIEEWLRSDANQETFYRWLAEWESKSPSYLPEMDKALDAYIKHLETSGSHPEPVSGSVDSDKIKPYRSYAGWLVAASVVFLFALAGWWNRDFIVYESFTTAFGETRSFLLADGSRVTLNANSDLQVPRFGFGRKNRVVHLQGEAYFSVRHQLNNGKFIVKTGKGFEVVVFGTEFSVFARPRGAKVLLDKGKVQVNYSQETEAGSVFLKPGDLLTLRENGAPEIQPVETGKYKAWKDHRFVFEHTEVQELAGMLRDIYGLSVKIEDSTIASRTLEGTFQAENADELLEVISELLQIKVTRNGNTVFLND